MGMRDPTGHSPEVIWARSWAITWSESGVRRVVDSAKIGSFCGLPHQDTGAT
ncbi:hypothetical protein KCH_57320 [Kitasatospora cheerisanensis KCTC 2395]|uniref:Uncharacterized protein n=1 Tax=Kitasatospora cheerisanensis KCTC 2395 TaxID=1348663 RepID=A0A066YRD4_9ACTN|nr:hypothetical protein KCH_57320 [Kitasatospora cheerisanensis KCTC 2395]